MYDSIGDFIKNFKYNKFILNSQILSYRISWLAVINLLPAFI